MVSRFYVCPRPHLLNLWGNPAAWIAGLVAAFVAGAQIVGGLLTPWIRRAFKRRTSALLVLEALAVAMLALIGLDQELLGRCCPDHALGAAGYAGGRSGRRT